MATCSVGGGLPVFSASHYPRPPLASPPDFAQNASAPSCTPWRLPTSLTSPPSPSWLTSPLLLVPTPRVSAPLPASAGPLAAAVTIPAESRGLCVGLGHFAPCRAVLRSLGLEGTVEPSQQQFLSERALCSDLYFQRLPLAADWRRMGMAMV